MSCSFLKIFINCILGLQLFEELYANQCILGHNQIYEKGLPPFIYIIKHQHNIEASDTNACHTQPRQDTRMPGTDTQPQQL